MKIFTRPNVLRGIFALVMAGALTILGLATAASLSGCATATINEPDVCYTVSLGTVPASPVAGLPLPPQTFSTNFDFSDPLNKVGDIANNLSANVSQLTMSNDGDLQWVSEVDVTVTGQNLPTADFATYTSSGSDPGQSVSVAVKMDQPTLLKYLTAGPITLAFTVKGTAPTQTVNFMNTMCVDVSGQVSKSL